MGGSLGSSINISRNAGGYYLRTWARRLIQGTSGISPRRCEPVKVHLKARYRVILYQEKD